MLYFNVCSWAQQASLKPSGATTVFVDCVLPKQTYGYQGVSGGEG